MIDKIFPSFEEHRHHLSLLGVMLLNGMVRINRLTTCPILFVHPLISIFIIFYNIKKKKGKNGLGDAEASPFVPCVSSHVQKEPAAVAISRLCSIHESVSILALGPLTNIALAVILSLHYFTKFV